MSRPPADPVAAPPGAAAPADPPLPAPTDRCPRCATQLLAGQYWCLQCGAPARTQVVTARRWRLPIIALLLLGVLAIAGIVYAFIKLSEDTGKAPATGPTGPTAPVPAPVGPTAPPATVPPATGGATGPTGPSAGATGPAEATPTPAAPGTAGAPTAPGATGAPASGAASVNVTADPTGALRYTQRSIQATAGKVTVVFANKSQVAHNVTLSRAGKPVGATPTITAAKAKAKVTVDLTAGIYTYYCSVDSHRGAGMQGTLVVG